jgi:hypothetical protein
MMKTMAVVLALLSTPAAAVDMSAIGHLNRDVNQTFASKPDSCLANARAKVASLRALGVDASVLIVARRGLAETHAMVHLRVDGETYYLDNRTNTIATAWPALLFIVKVEQ